MVIVSLCISQNVDKLDNNLQISLHLVTSLLLFWNYVFFFEIIIIQSQLFHSFEVQAFKSATTIIYNVHMANNNSSRLCFVPLSLLFHGIALFHHSFLILYAVIKYNLEDTDPLVLEVIESGPLYFTNWALVSLIIAFNLSYLSNTHITFLLVSYGNTYL